MRFRFAFVVPGFALFFGIAGGCGGGDDSASGPPTGCAALQACCNAITDPTTQASCNSTLSNDESLPNSDQTCNGNLVDYQSFCAGVVGDGGGGDEGGSSGPPAGGFSQTATQWTLPMTGYPAAAFQYATSGANGVGGCGGSPDYGTIDITNDGKLDLLVTDNCVMPSDGTGTTHWLVYTNSGTAFSTTATSWGLPSGAAAGAYDEYPNLGPPFDYGFENSGSVLGHDWNGDGKLDLVVNGSPSVFYANTGTAFSSTKTTITLPTGTGTLFDMDGDSLLDFVISNDMSNTSGVGTDHWLVSKGNSTGGFAAAINWTLPTANIVKQSFLTFRSTNNANNTTCPAYDVVDIDGDKISDLVVTNDCATNTTVGKDHWAVYKGGATGFASTSTSWTLPQVSVSGFSATSTSDYSGGTNGGGVLGESLNTISYQLQDYDGDGKADLWLVELGAGGSRATWQVAFNTGSGFGDARTWALPDAVKGGLAFTSYKDCDSNGNGPIFSVFDIDGDKVPDVVVTNDCAGATMVGTNYWDVYLGKASK